MQDDFDESRKKMQRREIALKSQAEMTEKMSSMVEHFESKFDALSASQQNRRLPSERPKRHKHGRSTRSRKDTGPSRRCPDPRQPTSHSDNSEFETDVQHQRDRSESKSLPSAAPPQAAAILPTEQPGTFDPMSYPVSYVPPGMLLPSKHQTVPTPAMVNPYQEKIRIFPFLNFFP